MDLEAQRKAAEERHKQYATAHIPSEGIHSIISGDARAAYDRGWRNGWFSCPVVTQVEDNLWQGGCRQGIVLPSRFKYVLSLYQWEKYTLPEGCERVEVEMYDAGYVPDVGQLDVLSDQINEWRSREDGDVLVHCQAGLNRSGLLTALSLVKRGMSPSMAITKLRLGRSNMVLCNQKFEEWLLAGNYDVQG